MQPNRLCTLLYIIGTLLTVVSTILRVNHFISFGVCFALITVGLLVIGKARRIRRAAAPR